MAKDEWSDAGSLARIRSGTLPLIVDRDSIWAWIVGDTGFPEKGCHSVGVGRQSCGQIGE